MVLVPLFLVTLLGCPIENTPGGTAVGNPTGLSLTPAPPTDFSFSSASVRLETATFTTCVGDPTVVTVGDTVDLLSGVDLTAPAGPGAPSRSPSAIRSG